MEIVPLKNGGKAPMPAVTTIMMALERLYEQDPIALYELRELCKNPAHQCFEDELNTLKALALVDQNGRVHDIRKDVVLSAVQGEGLDFRLDNPLAG